MNMMQKTNVGVNSTAWEMSIDWSKSWSTSYYLSNTNNKPFSWSDSWASNWIWSTSWIWSSHGSK